MDEKKFDRAIQKREATLAKACDGGCGKVERTSRRCIRDVAYYVCSGACESKLPALAFGSLRVCDYNAFGTFTGITDRPPFSQELMAIREAIDKLNTGPGSIGNLDI